MQRKQTELAATRILLKTLDWWKIGKPVKDWANYFETARGRRIERAKPNCRACILGSFFVASNGHSATTQYVVFQLIRDAKYQLWRNRSFTRPFTVPEIRKLLKRAIELSRK